ncbi:MAG: PAS domain S-box protein [Bacteroidota bacterium]
MPKYTEVENASRLSAIIETAIDGIITIDERGTIETMNPAASAIFGYEEGEVLGQNINVLMPEPYHSEHDEYLDRYHNTGHAQIIGIGREVTGKKKDGTIFPFRLAISEVNLEGRKIFTGIVHDLTHQKQSEERLRRYAADLERSNRELQDFAYISSHDLQEPLRKIQAFGSRIQSKEADKLSDQGQEYLSRMLNASRRMSRLINDLLGFSRLSTKALPFEQVDLNKILKEVISDLEIRIERTQAIVEVGDLPVVEADPTQMRQLFQNLIANALKFHKEGERPRVEVSGRFLNGHSPDATPGDHILEVRVKDNGIGFDVKYLDRIFKIFQRLEGRKYEGSGMGLAICKKITNRHGGDITAESANGKGTTFVVTLSRRQTEQ